MDHQTQAQKSPSSINKYKGRTEGGGAVIPQPDGRRTNWASAEIIYNHQNWLGQDPVPQTYDRVASMLRYSDETTQQSPYMNNNYQQNEDREEEEENEQTSAEIIEEDQDQKQDDEEEEEEEEEEEQHEHMFEKPLTPSDVGKLNRLVIPKQYAERYFPLSGDSSDKGLLLSFEDEAGKLWRFRYSYWNSSQSYVLTKGWSRFVKDKRLDAGDVVWFERRRFDVQRLFIRWRRRVVPVQHSRVMMTQQQHHHHHPNDAAAAAAAWTRMFYSAPQQNPYPSHHVHGSLLYQQPDCLHAVEPIIEKPIPKPVNSKRLRLFGVNLDCQLDEDEPPVLPDSSSLSSQARDHHFLYSQPDHYGSSNS